jgi:acyl-CoA reductase-like NAD-dependent aldehyde dehydrogenase
MATKKSANTMPLAVNKTYKIFIGGAFPRTESGRYTEVRTPSGNFVANVCLSSRKDFRNAVVAARGAQESWQDRSAYNRSQIVYRIAEMLQQREALFTDEMLSMGYTRAVAKREFDASVDLLVHYAGWCDKYMPVYSSVNPVASSHFNFSVPEPTGVVAALARQNSALLSVVEACIPAICGGNTVIILASEQYPLCAVTFAEVLATSDLPGGVINVLTGKRAELQSHFASHMDVNALIAWDVNTENQIAICQKASENVKRTHFYDSADKSLQPVDYIMDLQEIKTTWHPIEIIKGSGSGY